MIESYDIIIYINARRSKILHPCIFDTPRIRARRKPCIWEEVLRLTLPCAAEPLAFRGERKKYKIRTNVRGHFDKNMR